MPENLELVAKLRLETEEAEQKLNKMSKSATKGEATLRVPDDTTIELPKDTQKSLKDMFSELTQGGRGLDNLASIAKGATSGFNGVVGALGRVVKGFGKLSIVLAVIITAVKLISKLFEGTDSLEKMQAVLGALIESIRTVFAPVIALIAEIFAEITDTLRESVPLLNMAVQPLKTLLNGIANFLKMTTPIVKILVKIGEVFDKIRMIVYDLMNGLMVSFMNTFMPIIEGVVNGIVWALDKVVNLIDKFKKGLEKLITTLTFGLVKFDRTTSASTTGDLKKTYKSSLDTWETSGTETATEKNARLMAEASEQMAESARTLGMGSGNLLQDLRGFVTTLFSRFKEFGDKIIDFAGSTCDWIKTTAGNVWEWIKNVAGGFWETMKSFGTSIWNSIKSAGVGIWKGIKSAGTSIWSSIRNAGVSIWDAVKNKAVSVWESIFNFFKKLFSGIGNTAGKVWDGVKSTASSVWSGVKNFASNTWGGVKDFFGSLKFWDSGGTLSPQAQIWAMSEKGNPEFLFNAGGHKSVINADILSNAMYEAFMKADRGNGKLEVSIKEGLPSGPRELAQWLLPSLRVMLKNG